MTSEQTGLVSFKLYGVAGPTGTEAVWFVDVCPLARLTAWVKWAEQCFEGVGKIKPEGTELNCASNEWAELCLKGMG